MEQPTRRRRSTVTRHNAPLLTVAPPLRVDIPPVPSRTTSTGSRSEATTPTARSVASALASQPTSAPLVTRDTRGRSSSQPTTQGPLSGYATPTPLTSSPSPLVVTASLQISSPSSSRSKASRPSLTAASDLVSTASSSSAPPTASAEGGNPATPVNANDPANPSKREMIGLFAVNESLTHKDYRRAPILTQYSDDYHFPSSMIWCNSATFGTMPTHAFKGHTGSCIDGIIWVFGGQMPLQKGDLVRNPQICRPLMFRNVWCLDTESLQWSHPEMQGDSPPAGIRGHSASVYAANKIIVFGGKAPKEAEPGNYVYFNELWTLETKRRLWIKHVLSPDSLKPRPRNSHSSVIHQNRLYVFGGGDGSKALDDLWVLDMKDMSKLRWQEIKFPEHVSRPTARGYHSMTVIRNGMVLFGGGDPMAKSDMWHFNFYTYTWTNISSDDAPSRTGHSATLIGPHIFVLGGRDEKAVSRNSLDIYNASERLWETRSLSPEDKSRLAVVGQRPRPRSCHTAILEDCRLWMIGGWDGRVALDECWHIELASQAYLQHVTAWNIPGVEEI